MTIEERLDIIESRSAVADLVHAYALAVRRDQPEQVEALFAPDGTFEVREGGPDRDAFTVLQRFDSPQALVAYLVKSKGGAHPVPLIHNLMVSVDGDCAEASSVMAGPITGGRGEVFGEYADSFVRSAGEWRFTARKFTIFRDL